MPSLGGHPSSAAAVRQADAGALTDELYRAFRRDVYRVLLRDLRDPADAEDVTQVVFLDAYRALARGVRPRAPRAWLFAIARNAGRRSWRARARRRALEVELDPELAPAAQPQELLRSLQEALSGLPEQQRRTLLLHELAGLRCDEVASVLGLSRPAVESALFRARQALRAELAEGEALSHDAARKLLVRLLAAKLTRQERRLVESHVERCEECAREARRLRALRRPLGILSFPWQALAARLLERLVPSALPGPGAAAAAGALVLAGAIALPGLERPAEAPPAVVAAPASPLGEAGRAERRADRAFASAPRARAVVPPPAAPAPAPRPRLAPPAPAAGAGGRSGSRWSEGARAQAPPAPSGPAAAGINVKASLPPPAGGGRLLDPAAERAPAPDAQAAGAEATAARAIAAAGPTRQTSGPGDGTAPRALGASVEETAAAGTALLAETVEVALEAAADTASELLENVSQQAGETLASATASLEETVAETTAQAAAAVEPLSEELTAAAAATLPGPEVGQDAPPAGAPVQTVAGLLLPGGPGAEPGSDASP